jgi:hypothetical protein
MSLADLSSPLAAEPNTPTIAASLSRQVYQFINIKRDCAHVFEIQEFF